MNTRGARLFGGQQRPGDHPIEPLRQAVGVGINKVYRAVGHAVGDKHRPVHQIGGALDPEPLAIAAGSGQVKTAIRQASNTRTQPAGRAVIYTSEAGWLTARTISLAATPFSRIFRQPWKAITPGTQCAVPAGSATFSFQNTGKSWTVEIGFAGGIRADAWSIVPAHSRWPDGIGGRCRGRSAPQFFRIHALLNQFADVGNHARAILPIRDAKP